MSATEKHQLHTITNTQLQVAYEKQLENNEWNFFDERKHVEDLLCQRFNFLILAFSLFVTAFSTMQEEIYQFIILIIGFIVVVLISLTIIRAYNKLDVNLKILYKLQEANDTEKEKCVGYNAMSIIDNEVNNNGKLGLKNMNKTIGVRIPLVFIAIFGFGIIALGLKIWVYEKEKPTPTDTINDCKTEIPIPMPKTPFLFPSDKF